MTRSIGAARFGHHHPMLLRTYKGAIMKHISELTKQKPAKAQADPLLVLLNNFVVNKVLGKIVSD